ncbi:MAG: PAS domain S-box protein [Candidatus Dormibacteria bacterium]
MQCLASDAEEVLTVADSSGELIYVTPASERVFGVPADELLGRPAAELFEPGDFERLIRPVARGLEGRRRTNLQCRHRDGSWHTLEARAERLEPDSPDGEVGTVIFCRDVTEEAQSRRDLRETDERLSEVFDNSPIGITEVAVDGRILDANPAVCALLGHSREELLELKAMDLVIPADRDERDAALQALLAGARHSVTYDVRFQRQDGEVRDAEVIASLLRDDHGQPHSFLLLMQDITEREELEVQVSAQADLLEHAHDAIFVKQLQDSTITFWNSGAEELYGYDSATAIGRVSHELLRTEYRTPLSEVEERLRRTGEWSGEMVHMTSTGEPVWVHSRWAVIRDTDGRALAALEVNRDITPERNLAYERERLMEILEQQNRELRASDRMKSEFLLTISHELRTPLTAILGYADLMALDPALAGRTEIEEIQGNGHRLLGLIDDVLTLAQAQAGELQLRRRPIDLAILVARVVEDEQGYARDKGIILRYEAAAAEVPALADEMATSHLLRHLVNNAIKFTSRGEVVVALSASDEEVRVEVQDTGIGVPQEARGLIFQEFTQADQSTTRRHGGVGVGLSVVQRLVTLQGGQVGLIDRPTGGSVFWFSLPTAAGGNQPVPKV